MPEMKYWWHYVGSFYAADNCWQLDEDSFVSYHAAGGSSSTASVKGQGLRHTRDKATYDGNYWWFNIPRGNDDQHMLNFDIIPTVYDPLVNYMVIDAQPKPYKFFGGGSVSGLYANFWRYNGQNIDAFRGDYGYVAHMLEDSASIRFSPYGIEGKNRTKYEPGNKSQAMTNMGTYGVDKTITRVAPNTYLMIGAVHANWGSSTSYGAPRYIRAPGDDSPNQDNDEIYPEGAVQTEFAGNAVSYFAARAYADDEEAIKPFRKQPPRTLTLRTFWRKPMDNATANLVEGEPSTVKVSYDPDTWGTMQDEQGNSYWSNPDLRFTDYTLGARPADAGPDWIPVSKVRITSSLLPEKCTIQAGNAKGTHKYHYLEFSPMHFVSYRGTNDQYDQPNGYDDIDLRYYETNDYTNQSGNYDQRDLPYSRSNYNWHISGARFLCTGTSITIPMNGRYRPADEEIPVETFTFASWDGVSYSSITGGANYQLWSSFDPHFYFSSNEVKYPRASGVKTDVMKDAAVFNYNSWYPAERGSFLNYCPYRNGEEPYRGLYNWRAPFASPVIIDNKAYTWTLNYQKQYILVTVDLGEELSMEVEVRDDLPKKLIDETPLFKILTEGKTPEGLFFPEPQMYLYESYYRRHIQRKNSAYYYVPAFAGATGTKVPSKITYDPWPYTTSEYYYHGWPLPIVPVQLVRASRVDGKTIRTDIYEGQGNSLSYYSNAIWSQPPFTRGSEHFRNIEFGGWFYHSGRGQGYAFIFDYKDVGYGEPIPLKMNQRDDGLGIRGGSGRMGYFGQNGGWSSRLKNGGSW